MPRSFDTSNVSRREFLAAAGTIAAVSSIAVAKDSGLEQPLPPPAPADYNVLIDAQQPTFAYTTDQPAPNTPAYHLKIPVASGSTVRWKVKSPSTRRCVGIYFPNNTPLLDGNGRPLYAVLWSETEEGANQLKLTVDPEASGAYEYVVVLFDRQSYATHRDDPKMIVGSGNIELMAELSQEVKKLGPVANECPSQSQDIRRIQEKLQGIINKLE